MLTNAIGGAGCNNNNDRERKFVFGKELEPAMGTGVSSQQRSKKIYLDASGKEISVN